VAAPPGQITTSPAAQSVMSQFWVPAVSAGQWTKQVPSQLAWQGPAAQVKSQVDSGPQVHVPLAHVPLHEKLLPSQVTWHGGASHWKAQVLPVLQVQPPLAHAPLHDGLSPSQLT
jgi:hypothetical protein